MKLRIEPLNRISLSTIAHYDKAEDANQLKSSVSVELGVQLEQQLRKNWCWAAVACALANYYGASSGSDLWRQETLAWEILGESVELSKEQLDQLLTSSQFDQCAQLEQVLDRAGCLANWSSARPPFRRLMRELDAGRPLAASVGWRSGGHHYLLIDGYHRSQRTIHVLDSQTGQQQVCFDRFPQNYRAGGEWVETFWTKGCKNLGLMEEYK